MPCIQIFTEEDGEKQRESKMHIPQKKPKYSNLEERQTEDRFCHECLNHTDTLSSNKNSENKRHTPGTRITCQTLREQELHNTSLPTMLKLRLTSPTDHWPRAESDCWLPFTSFLSSSKRRNSSMTEPMQREEQEAMDHGGASVKPFSAGPLVRYLLLDARKNQWGNVEQTRTPLTFLNFPVLKNDHISSRKSRSLPSIHGPHLVPIFLEDLRRDCKLLKCSQLIFRIKIISEPQGCS